MLFSYVFSSRFFLLFCCSVDCCFHLWNETESEQALSCRSSSLALPHAPHALWLILLSGGYFIFSQLLMGNAERDCSHCISYAAPSTEIIMMTKPMIILIESLL